MKKRVRWKALPRMAALGLAACTLWGVAVTANSDTFSAAISALRTQASSPLSALQWELGDLFHKDGLSPAAALTIGESPLLLSARETVAELLTKETGESDTSPAQSQQTTTPVTETPVETPPAAAPSPNQDNGVTARTLIPTDESGYTVAGKVYISNSTKHTLDIQSLTAPFAASLTDEAPQILIIHTHGSEAYTPVPGTAVNYSGDHRTTDTRYNVVQVGDVMAQAFADAGISVLHDRTLYDYPSYAGSYDRSLKAIESYLAQYPSIHFVLDIHRDAIEDTQGTEYKVISTIDGAGTAAQVTIVVGSDGSGLPHPNWMENMKLAVAVQQNILQAYPTLARPILLRNSRYNQHATAGSLLMEIGAAGNSPAEAALAGKLVAQRMADVLQGKSK